MHVFLPFQHSRDLSMVQGQQNWHERVKFNGGNDHAKSERSCPQSLSQKANNSSEDVLVARQTLFITQTHMIFSVNAEQNFQSHFQMPL